MCFFLAPEHQLQACDFINADEKDVNVKTLCIKCAAMGTHTNHLHECWRLSKILFVHTVLAQYTSIDL